MTITKETIRHLFALTGNTCAFSNCGKSIYDEKGIYQGEVCHIEAGKEGGPRYNHNLSQEKRDRFENLLVLCPYHHTVIDKDPPEYTVEKLKEIKTNHENKHKSKPFEVSDKQIEEIIEKIYLSQHNTQTGSGTQINTQTGDVNINYGLRYEELQSLVNTLLENNFPKLQQIAKEAAKDNVEKFAKTFFEKAKELNKEEQAKFTDPDIQFALTKAIEANARKDSDELRNILSSLMIKRVQNDQNDLKRIVLNEAIFTINKLTVNELKIITLCFIVGYTADKSIQDFASFNNYLEKYIGPFLSFKDTVSEFEHIQYTGCGSLEITEINLLDVFNKRYPIIFFTDFDPPEIENLGIPEIIKNDLFLFNPLLNKYRIKHTEKEEFYKLLNAYEISPEARGKIDSLYQHHIMDHPTFTKLMEEKTQDGKRLLECYKNSRIQSLRLTSVGKAIAASFLEQTTGIKLNIDIWIN